MDLKTTRMLLRDFIPEDAADLQEILGDAEVMEFSEAPYDLEKTKAFLASFCIEKHGAVAAVHKESGKVIGYILFSEIEPDVYEMGWFFNRRFWRQGYAYESCKAVIDYAFSGLNVRKIVAETIDTRKSVALMEKLGMHPEGIQRNQTRDHQGNQAHLYIYGLLADDWRKQ